MQLIIIRSGFWFYLKCKKPTVNAGFFLNSELVSSNETQRLKEVINLS